jgi:hypothetical protein
MDSDTIEAAPAGKASKAAGFAAEIDNSDHKDRSACPAGNLACLKEAHRVGKPRRVRHPTANDLAPIARLPLGRPDPSGGVIPSGIQSDVTERSATFSKAAPANVTTGAFRHAETVADSPNTIPLPRRKPQKIARSQNPRREGALKRDRLREDRGNGSLQSYEMDRAARIKRSSGPRGFWAWSW